MLLQGTEFQMFSIIHYSILGYIGFLGFLLIVASNHLSAHRQHTVRHILGWIIPSLYILEIFIAIVLGYYTFYEFFPMHLCSIMVILCPIALISKNQRIFEITYYYGVFSAFAALLFPALIVTQYYDLRIMIFLLKHGLLVIAPLYLISVEGMRPTISGMLKSMLISIAFTALIVYPFNRITDSNYIYLLYGPSNTPLETIDKTYGYPLYLGFLSALALIVPFLMHIPFIIGSLHKKEPSASSTEGS